MIERQPLLCPRCAGEITAGILFCWRHPESPPKVGEVRADHGQLLWTSTSACSATMERPLAVLLDGVQVSVADANELLNTRPCRINLALTDPRSPSGTSVDAHIDLTALFEAIAARREEIEAVRTQ